MSNHSENPTTDCIDQRARGEAGGARNRLVEENLDLVHFIARRYAGRGVDHADLFQSGCEGLIRAAEDFDSARGTKFGTYAFLFIRQDVSRAVVSQGRSIRPPFRVAEDVQRVARSEEELAKELRREPSEAELAEAMGLPAERLRDAKRAAVPVASLDAPLSEDGELLLGDTVADDAWDSDPYRIVCRKELRREFVSALNELPRRERNVLVLRYGLDGKEELTFGEIGKKLGVSGERARQIAAQGIAHLRTSPRMESIRDLRGDAY